MTRRDFELLSQALRDARFPASPPLSEFAKGFDYATAAIADALADRVGPSFDRERFLRDAGVKR